HRRVSVMPTTVKTAGAPRAMGKGVVFVHGQGIHIRPEPDTSTAAPRQRAHDARLGQSFVYGKPPVAQAGGDETRGVVFREGEFRFGVDGASPVAHRRRAFSEHIKSGHKA